MSIRVEVRNVQGDLLTLQLGDSSNGIVLRDVSGLGPVKASLSSTSFANLPGAQFQSSRRDVRNITMKLGLEPDASVMSVYTLRSQIYKFFSTEMQVDMKIFYEGSPNVNGYEILGIVESCDPGIFTQDPSMDISVVCFNPDFYNPVPVTISGMTTADTDPTHIVYPGSSKNGIQITVNVNRSVTELIVYYIDPAGNTWTMDIAYAFVAGDTVVVNTIEGQKYANLTRSGVTTSILYAISPQSTWPEFKVGNNWLRVSATGAAIPVSVVYTELFGEV